jgi:peroxiredoxin (alkyl hydroperoxide reductase subunit C)
MVCVVARMINHEGGSDMSDGVMGLQVGQKVPSFEIETYDPIKGDFGTISLDTLKAEGKWTILFFYPADFTFV